LLGLWSALLLQRLPLTFLLGGEYMEDGLPESHEVLAILVPTPDKAVIPWLDEVLGFISTEAYS